MNDFGMISFWGSRVEYSKLHLFLLHSVKVLLQSLQCSWNFTALTRHSHKRGCSSEVFLQHAWNRQLSQFYERCMPGCQWFESFKSLLGHIHLSRHRKTPCCLWTRPRTIRILLSHLARCRNLEGCQGTKSLSPDSSLESSRRREVSQNTL